MESIALGQSPLQVSRLAYGCWRIGGWESCEITPERQASGRKAVIAAYESGYTFFDHADVYCAGEAEKIFGQVLKEVGGMRDRVVISSKCGIRQKGDPSPDAPYRYDFSAGHIILSCEQSLRRLDVDTIDLYQLHRPDLLMRAEEVAEAFSRLRKTGKVREFGVSNFRPAQVRLLQKFCPMRLEVNQVEISLMELSRFNDGTLDQCQMEQMTPLAWSPLAGGRLSTNDPITLREPDHAHRLRIREMLDLAARHYNVSRGVIAIAWLLKHPAQIIPIVGSTDPGRIRELTQAVKLSLSREEWYRLFEAAYGARLP